jgi:deoxyribodipyrimidine photo-lyase
MKAPLVIHWFRQDLRLSDNPALRVAINRGTVLPIYILDNQNAKECDIGAASKWWLHHSLAELNHALGGALSLYQGNPIEILAQLIERLNVSEVYWNRCYEPWQIQRDEEIKLALKAKGIEVRSYNGSLLWEPWDIKKPDGTPYKVFTPFYRKGCLQAPMPREPIPKPDEAEYLGDVESRLDLDSLGLLPKIRWDKGFEDQWEVGENGAHKRFQAFIKTGLAQYKEGRNLPAKPYVSRLSPYLHFGEISPNQLWYAVQSIADSADVDHFCSELAWREFSYSQLYYHPTLPTKNLKQTFDLFPWVEDKAALKAWQTGNTGIPMVDAGMRELWQTGFMHNRVRMIVASFLVKNLRLHWHQGERWFWDTLVDADLANNSASWQWVAGCGADAAPYFRIFNPVIQGQKFDSEGDYVRHFVPEIALLPNKYLFNPWDAPESILQEAKVTLGEDYPKPIVDLKASREAALLAYKML